MRIRLPRAGRTYLTILAGAILGAFLAGAGPQLASAIGRPACAETVMKAVSTEQIVSGTYSCFDTNMQIGLQTIGVDSDRAFAQHIGQAGEYHFLRKTADGGYVYEYDRPTAPHDEMQGAASYLGLQKTRADLRRWNLGAAFNERRDLRGAWAEITGQTQNPESRLFTIYIGGDGRIIAIK